MKHFFKKIFLPSTARGKLIRTVLLYFVCWQIVLTGIGFLASGILGQQPPQFSHSYMAFIEHIDRWDAGWYHGIAEHDWYRAVPQSPAFFPVFPILLHYVGNLFSGNDIVAAYIINTVATAFAFVFLALIALDVSKDRRRAFTVVLIFSLFPTAFFLHSMYAEALLCAFGFSAYYFARQARWWLVGVLLCLCCATRLPGIFFGLLCLLEYLQQISWKLSKIRPTIAWFLLAPVGLLAYMIYLHGIYGNYLYILQAYKAGPFWSFQRFNPDEPGTLYHTLHASASMIRHKPDDWVKSLFYETPSALAWLGSLIIGAIALIKRQLAIPLGIFVLASCLFIAQNGNFISLSRYLLPLFPLYIWLEARLQKHPEITGAYLGLSGAFLGLCLGMFAGAFWVG